MTTTTTPRGGVSFAQAAATLAGHLAEHALPEPVSLSVTTSWGHSEATAQLRSDTVASVAADLLTWADTLSAVTVEAWRPPERDRVHLSLRSTLTSPAAAIELKVFGGVDYDPHRFADLEPDPHRGVCLSLGQLRSWATGEPATAGNLVSPASGAHR